MKKSCCFAVDSGNAPEMSDTIPKPLVTVGHRPILGNLRGTTRILAIRFHLVPGIIAALRFATTS